MTVTGSVETKPFLGIFHTKLITSFVHFVAKEGHECLHAASLNMNAKFEQFESAALMY